MAEISSSTWSETDASNNTASPDGAPEGMLPSGVDDTIRQIMGSLKRAWDRLNGTVTTTGSAGAYLYATSNTNFPAAYVNGEVYRFIANFTSVGADTLAVNALAAKPLYRRGRAGIVGLAAGDIRSGDVIEATYNAALNGAAGGFQIDALGTYPTRSIITGGSGTYTTPAGVQWIEVEMVGGGGGGGGGGSAPTAGTAGGNTTFSTLTAGGGQNNGNAGGSASGGDINIVGGVGAGGSPSVSGVTNGVGGPGAASYFGGQGTVIAGNAGGAAAVNSGAGGGGGAAISGNTNNSGGGGSSGGFVSKIIGAPAATYSYAVGAAGTGGAAGANGAVGGAGGSGIIIVTEHYNP